MAEQLALMVQVEDNYGCPRVAAHVHTVADDESLRNILWTGGREPFERFDGFAVTAYLDVDRGVWGPGCHVEVRMDRARHARAVASLLATVERGLDRLNGSNGYLPADDYASYLLRVARVLRVSRITVRNSPRRRELTGDTFRSVNGSGLQSWTDDVRRVAKAGELATLVRSGR